MIALGGIFAALDRRYRIGMRVRARSAAGNTLTQEAAN